MNRSKGWALMKPKKPSTCVRWGLGPFTRIEVGWELYLVMPSHCSPYSQSFFAMGSSDVLFGYQFSSNFSLKCVGNRYVAENLR